MHGTYHYWRSRYNFTVVHVHKSLPNYFCTLSCIMKNLPLDLHHCHTSSYDNDFRFDSAGIKNYDHKSVSYWYRRMSRLLTNPPFCMATTNSYTLFPKRSAHWFTPVLPVTPGHVDFVKWSWLSRPIDKIKMTRDRGRWPKDLRKLGWLSCALLLEKRVGAYRQVFEWPSSHKF